MKGNSVEHTDCSNGVLLNYVDKSKTSYYDDCIVKFNSDAQCAQGKDMTVKVGHLEKII